METSGGTQPVPNLAALVSDARAGKPHALDELIALHLPLVYNLVGRALNGHADVDDVVQETMLRMVRGLAKLRDPQRFRSWLVAIAYRQIHLYLRERSRAWPRVPDAALEMPDPGSDFAERTVTELMLTGQRRELAESARWLDDADRRLLSLWWQEATGEVNRHELAAALGVSPRHAAVRLHRLRARLDAARCLVRALRANPRCPGLTGLTEDWNSQAGPLWRKRLNRHVRDCLQCGQLRAGLLPPEDLLLGVSYLPLPVSLAVPAAWAQVAVPAGQSFGQWLLAQIQGFIHSKTAVAATAVTIVTGGTLLFAVYQEPLPESPGPIAIASPTAAPQATAAQPPAVASPSSPAPSSAATQRAPLTGVASADIHVAPGGSDTGDGSLAKPYATLSKAVAEVQPGQTIALRGGTYLPSEPVVIETSGEPQRRITLSNYRDERPVIDASRVPADKWMITHQAGYWTVQGLEIKHSRSHAFVCRSCRHNVLQRLSIHDNVRSALTLRDPGTVGNLVLDSDFFRNYDPADPGTAGVGLAVKFGSGDGNVVRGCRAFHNADVGFDIGYFERPVTLEHNWSYGNGVNRWGREGWRSNADGFLLGGGSPAPAVAHVVRHNAAWDNAGHGFSDGANPGTLRLDNNTSFRNGATGFHLPTGAAAVRGNASIANRSTVTAGEGSRSSSNTWDGGDWSIAMFQSTVPITAQQERQPDGRLPSTDFLSSSSGLGASMSLDGP
ncbi:MAG TPA: sigma-70 family RNA polymerase sigma factor [Candidatus Limnocylindrales bacterium]